METKETWGELKSKPVTTEMPGPPQLQALLSVAMATSVLRNALFWDSRLMGISSQSWGQDDPDHLSLDLMIWEIFFNLNDSAILCDAAQYLGPVHQWDVEGEGRVRLELRTGWKHSLSSSCYQKEKGEERKGKAGAEHFFQAPALTTLCVRDQSTVLPLPLGQMLLVRGSGENL